VDPAQGIVRVVAGSFLLGEKSAHPQLVDLGDKFTGYLVRRIPREQPADRPVHVPEHVPSGGDQ
jgi:hypothetical protein